MSIFATLKVYYDIDSRPAALNMAIDEALFENATAPAIRFYRWDHPALSFGYFGKFGDVANEEPAREIVRRWTGGGIVFHGEDLTYSIVVPASDAAFDESSMSIYEKVHHAVCDALSANGHAAELASGSTLNAQRSTFNAQCFVNPVRADVLWNGRKVAGAAQRRTRRGLLQQGSIQGVELDADFGKSFAALLCDNCEEKTLNARILHRAREIADQKYATSTWLHRR